MIMVKKTKSNAKLFDTFIKLKKVIKSVETLEQYKSAYRMWLSFNKLYMNIPWGRKKEYHHSINSTLTALFKSKKSEINMKN